MGKKALFVIDMQNDLCLDARRRHKVEQVLGPLKRVIDLFVSTGQSVFYPCLALKEDDEQFKRFGDRYCVEGTDGAEIIPELRPLKGPVILKRKHSAFFETDLDRRLKELQVADVYLAGLQTHICIMTTAADASFRGYRTIAIRCCVLSTTEENKTSALAWIASYVGEVLTESQVASELTCSRG